MNNRIKIVRQGAGLSMEQFAQKIGVTRSSISKIESGQNNPSDQTLMLICREFNINEDWLRTGEGEMKIEDCQEERFAMNVAKFQRTDDETIIRWVNAVAETNPEVLREIEGFMKKILGIEDE